MRKLVYFALYGTPQQAAGWLKLLEQEGLPYRLRETIDQGAIFHIKPAGVAVWPPPDAKGVWIVEEALPPGITCVGTTFTAGFYFPEIGWVNAPGQRLLAAGGPDRGLGRIDPFHISHDDPLSFPLVLEKNGQIYMATSLSPLLTCQGAVFRKLEEVDLPELLFSLNPVDKAKVMQTLRDLVRRAFTIAGLPYFHCWYYPDGAPTIFLFRQDLDYYHPAGINNLLEITRAYDIHGSFFVNMSGEEEVEDELGQGQLTESLTMRHMDDIRRLSKVHEVGNHGYWHKIYRNVEDNHENLRRANRMLEEGLGKPVQGFASPGGSWHHGLAEAVKSLGFQYCSCNTWKHDGLPDFLDADGGSGPVLHIPSSPIYFPEFNDQEFESAKLQEIYLSYVNRQISLNQPIAIMGHPHIDGPVAEDLYGPVFALIKTQGIPSLTYLEFADWWIERKLIHYQVYLEDQTLIFTTDKPFFLALDGKLYEMRKYLEIPLQQLAAERNLENPSGFPIGA